MCVHALCTGLTCHIASLYLGIHAAAVSRVYSDLMRSLGASKKLFHLLDLSPSPVSSLPASRHPLLAGTSATSALFEAAPSAEDSVRPAPSPAATQGLAIEFDHVSFCYPQRTEAPVLTDLSLTIPSGAVVGFCGASGCGKSTLARLITKLYQPTGGTIRVNGLDINTAMTAAELRQHIGVVSQEALLFDRTVRENLLYGNLGASEEAMLQAANDANAHDFISNLPDGYALVCLSGRACCWSKSWRGSHVCVLCSYDSRIGERGITLSGGERARLAIARALIRQPALLILDEASAAVGYRS